jgi:hypothetical protein
MPLAVAGSATASSHRITHVLVAFVQAVHLDPALAFTALALTCRGDQQYDGADGKNDGDRLGQEQAKLAQKIHG